MKFLVAIAALAAMPCLAQVSTFYNYTRTVEIDCVLAYDGSKPVGVYSAYRVRLGKIDEERFFPIEVVPRAYDAECTGSFDTSTNLYRDVVNAGSESYSVGLRRTGKNEFKLEWAKWRGPATTSLWTVTNGQNTVYLAGTIHILRNSDYPLPRSFEEAYAKASQMFFEIDMDDPEETGRHLSAEEVQNEMRDPLGRTLTQTLSPANYAALRDYMKARGLSIDAVNTWSVDALLNLLSSYEMAYNYGFNAGGVDEHIAKLAMRDGKPIAGLETRARQTELLVGLAPGDENTNAESFLAHVGSGAMLHDLEAMVATWRTGNTEWITTHHIEPMRESEPDYYMAIQVSRNNAWVPQIEAMLQSSPTEMVVVGAAHMAGEDGLLAQLRRRGYHVEKY